MLLTISRFNQKLKLHLRGFKRTSFICQIWSAFFVVQIYNSSLNIQRERKKVLKKEHNELCIVAYNTKSECNSLKTMRMEVKILYWDETRYVLQTIYRDAFWSTIHSMGTLKQLCCAIMCILWLEILPTKVEYRLWFHHNAHKL